MVSTRSRHRSKSGHAKGSPGKDLQETHTGEVIETKGGNHKGLKEWKSEHGAETVESWLTS